MNERERERVGERVLNFYIQSTLGLKLCVEHEQTHQALFFSFFF